MREPLRYRIKVCGLTTPIQAAVASSLGVDAIGLVFYPRSKRYVSVEQALEIRRALPPFVAAVALFVDPDPADVEAVITTVRPDLLQFHGQESAAFCAAFARPYLKAISMLDGTDPRFEMDAHPDAQGFLLDSHGQGKMGGSGVGFDWRGIPEGLPRPWLLAGGLGPDNVAGALRATLPFGVDVSSGVEDAPGSKNPELIKRFVLAVRQAELE